MAEKINLTEKLRTFDEYWAPRTVGRFNDCDIKVAKVKGEFVWHKHEETDDFLYVLSGRLTVRLRQGELVLDPGELVVVPKGVEHQTYAEDETHLLLIELLDTPNTGDDETAAPRREI